MRRAQTYAIVFSVTAVVTAIYWGASRLVTSRASFLVFVAVFLGLALLLEHFVHRRQQ